MKRLVPVLALLLGAGVASAQSIGFETVGGGSTGPFGPAKNTVVKSDAELTSSGVRALLTPGAQLDFQSEMVIAVQMGTRNTGGYGIEVKGITRTQLAGGGYALDVAVESRSPGPGDMVTMAITSPFHVVKLRRFANDQVRFVAPSAGAAFDVVERSISSMPRGESIRIERATGKVVLQRTQINALIAPIEGTATAAELDALATALTTNDFKGLPASIPPPNPAPMDYPYLFLKVTGGSQAHEVRGLAGFHPASVAARLRAINGAIDAISSRIGTPPAFDVVERSISSLPRGEHVRIERATGKVVLQRTRINALIAPVEGTATAAELATLAAALVDNEFSDLPASLPPPNPAPMDVPYLRLKVTGGSQAHEVSGIAGFYPASLSARIRNIHAAIDPIVARLGSNVPPADEVKGVVRVAGGSVYLDEQPGVSYRLSGPVAATVRKFVGKTVKVEGTSLPASGFEAKKLLYPETLTDEQVFPIPTGSGLHTYVRHEEVRVSGPAARVVTRLARGKAVKVDGFLFLGGPQASTPEEVFAERVAATVDAYTVLTRLGQPAGYVRKGDEVEVLDLSSDGRSVLVRKGDRSGWMRASRLTLDEIPQPLHGPAPTTGLSGSVPGQ